MIITNQVLQIDADGKDAFQLPGILRQKAANFSITTQDHTSVQKWARNPKAHATNRKIDIDVFADTTPYIVFNSQDKKKYGVGFDFATVKYSGKVVGDQFDDEGPSFAGEASVDVHTMLGQHLAKYYYSTIAAGQVSVIAYPHSGEGKVLTAKQIQIKTGLLYAKYLADMAQEKAIHAKVDGNSKVKTDDVTK